MLPRVSQPPGVDAGSQLSHSYIFTVRLLFALGVSKPLPLLEERKTVLSAGPEGRNYFAAEPEWFTVPRAREGSSSKLGRCYLPDSRLGVFGEHS